MPWWGILIIIAAVIAAGIFFLVRLGKKTQKRQEDAQERINASKQTVNMLIIDKKKMPMKDAGFPQFVIDGTPKMMRRSKVPVVKAKVGPKISTFLASKEAFDLIPVKKEVKAEVSGLYIVGVKGLRGALVSDKAKKKKQSKFETLLKKGRGEI